MKDGPGDSLVSMVSGTLGDNSPLTSLLFSGGPRASEPLPIISASLPWQLLPFDCRRGRPTAQHNLSLLGAIPFGADGGREGREER